jgi:anti-sigma factor RsiW
VINELTCQELVELVTDYFENALDRDDRDRFERHVTTCSGCTRYVRQMRRTIDLLAAVTRADSDETDGAS